MRLHVRVQFTGGRSGRSVYDQVLKSTPNEATINSPNDQLCFTATAPPAQRTVLLSNDSNNDDELCMLGFRVPKDTGETHTSGNEKVERMSVLKIQIQIFFFKQFFSNNKCLYQFKEIFSPYLNVTSYDITLKMQTGCHV